MKNGALTFEAHGAIPIKVIHPAPKGRSNCAKSKTKPEKTEGTKQKQGRREEDLIICCTTEMGKLRLPTASAPWWEASRLERVSGQHL